MTECRGYIGLATAAVAGLSLVLVTGASADPGHVPGPPPSPPGLKGAPPPGQAKKAPPAPPAAAPAHPSHPSHPSHPARSSHAAPAHPSHPAHPAAPAHTVHPATPTTSSPPSPHAKAGKETICHATGSAKNPYVEITISRNAIPAHTRHQDGRDIVPAPAGGCPGAAGDAGSTPATTGATPSAVTGAPAASSGAAAAAPSRVVVAALRHTVNHSRKAASVVHVAGVRASGRPSVAASRVRVLARSMRGSLPFTGLQVFGILALGMLLIGAGLAVRSRA